MKLELDLLLDQNDITRIHASGGMEVLVAGHIVCAETGRPAEISGDTLGDATLQEVARRLHDRYAGDAVLALRKGASFALVRPAFSELPVYYRLQDDTLTVWTGLEIPPMLSTRPPSFNLGYLGTALLAGGWLTPQTGFDGVFELLSGAVLLCEGAEIRQIDLLAQAAESLGASAHADFAEELERFRNLIAEGVRHKTAPYAGCFSIEASGGLDSSVIAVAAAALHPKARLPLLNSYSEEDLNGDERYYFEAIADHVRGRRTVVDTNAWAVRESMSPELLAPTVRPCKMASAAATAGQMFFRAQDNGSKMVLTGDGGDQLFLRTRRAYIAREIMAEAATVRQSLLAPIELAMQERCSLWSIMREVLGGKIEDEYRDRFFGTNAFVENLVSEVPLPMHDELVPNFHRLSRLPTSKAFQYLGMRMAELNRIQFRHCAVVERKPFLFWPLVRAAIRARRQYHFAHGRDRALQREAFREQLPAAVYHRIGKGSARDPLARFDYSALAARLERGPACRYGLVSRQRLASVLERPIDERAATSLLRATAVSDWMEVHETD